MSKAETQKAKEVTKATKDELVEATVDETQVGVANEVPMGFEDEEAGDVLIPRVKVVQTLTPERKEGLAEEGDIINSLTLDKLNGKKFIPVFKFNNNIYWKERSDGGGILCRARDGKVGVNADGSSLVCAACKKCEFDNSKQGKEAFPKCTKYINFLGFFEGEQIPVILSFSKTNYAEGKKMYSLAKVTMQNMWNYSYILKEKLVSKGGNEWYIVNTVPGGATTPEERQWAHNMYMTYRNMNDIKFDMVDTVADTTSDADDTKTEF